MAGEIPSQLAIEINAQDQATAVLDNYAEQLARAERQIEALAAAEQKRNQNAQGNLRVQNRQNQAMLEASRGIEDFVIVASQQGLSFQGISNAMRGASNNISQYVALQYGAQAATLAAGLAIGAVLIPKVIEMAHAFITAKGPIGEINEELENQIALAEQIEGLNPFANLPEGGPGESFELDSIQSQISAQKKALKELGEEAVSLKKNMEETNFTDIFSGAAVQAKELTAIEERQKGIIIAINTLENERLDIKRDQKREENRIKESLDEQKEKRKLLAGILEDRTTNPDQPKEFDREEQKRRLIGAGFTPLTVDQAFQDEDKRDKKETDEFKAREALGLKTDFEIREEKRIAREEEQAAKKAEREEERRERSAGRLREQLHTRELGLGGLDKGVGLAKELAKFVTEAQKNLPEGERTAAIDEFAEVQRRRAGELIKEDKPVSPAVRDLLGQQRQVQLDALKADDPHKQKMEENARVALDLIAQILAHAEDGGGAFFQ